MYDKLIMFVLFFYFMYLGMCSNFQLVWNMIQNFEIIEGFPPPPEKRKYAKLKNFEKINERVYWTLVQHTLIIIAEKIKILHLLSANLDDKLPDGSPSCCVVSGAVLRRLFKGCFGVLAEITWEMIIRKRRIKDRQDQESIWEKMTWSEIGRRMKNIA